jgi:tetratricopeptide (TPR) repeat protein
MNQDTFDELADPPGICMPFQVDLSCLLDGELEEAAAARAMLHLESCPSCRAFFEDTREYVRLHRDIADPARLLARLTMLTGAEIEREVRSIELVNQLATIFYQLGKAYLLTAVDPGYQTRIFEKALPLESTRSDGWRFVDDVLGRGEGGERVDWHHARHMLNGQLKSIGSPLQKARRLLKEACEADPSHEEARLYMAFLERHDGKRLKAAKSYRQIFRTALHEANRGHAAVQLGQLYAEEGDFRKALACFRWVTASGLADRDERFFFVRLNIGMDYAFIGDRERAIAYFRTLLDRHPERRDEVVELFAQLDDLHETIDATPGFGEQLIESCPEFFPALPTGFDSAG